MRLNNQLKTILLLGGLSAFLVAIGWTIGPGATWLFLGLALAMNVGAYFFSDKLVLRMHGARELAVEDAPGLHGMVEELAQRAGIPKPRVFLIDDPSPNAFATGRNPEKGVVAVTQGILELLDRRELRGVIAHELAHIKNRDILVATIAAAIASAVTYVAQAVSFSALLGGASEDEEEGSAANGLLVALVAPIAATLIQLGISRSREYLADESGATISGDPEALARALEKLSRGAELVPSEAAQPATASLYIVNPLSGARVARLFSTHPPMEERIERLRALAQRRSSLAA
ncbi:zinc metalloprotease HtpX [Candidatus Binatia bacterium]|nr:zinc metalloprotease HtpX [Candidatus Binatia bacterium]